MKSKSRRDYLETDIKQNQDRIHLLRLAIEQKKKIIEEKGKYLDEITKSNTELRLKLPRYRKGVSQTGKRMQMKQKDLQKQSEAYEKSASHLASFRRKRIRQLVNYIFPVYVSQDTW